MTRSRVLLIALLTAIIGVSVFYMTRTARARNHAELVRDSVHVLRIATDSCAAVLEQRKSDMRIYTTRIDSLRGRVRELEALRPGGVPADSYRIYMQAFDRYNASAAAWTGPADALRNTLQSCRALAERHNVFVDSLRDLLRNR